MEIQTDPFAARVLFLRGGWMRHYRGITGGDRITGGGAYVATHDLGHEMFNFQPFQGHMYGYVRPVGRLGKRGGIDLTRLGGLADDESVPGVLAVWVATLRNESALVVGWYRNATVSARWQPRPLGSIPQQSGEEWGHHVTATADDAVLLPCDERVFPIPQGGKGAFGQSNVWYADDPTFHRQLRIDVLRYVATRQLPESLTGGSAPRQPDPLLRQKVERSAVEATVAHFSGLGYRVHSVERDNVGWDLDASLGQRVLKLEVKGLAGLQTVVELTPNEYAMMREYQESYRVCVVNNTLIAPSLAIFGYSPESRQWETEQGRILHIETIVAARCSST